VLEPTIIEKDWPCTLENIKEYVASHYGGTGVTLDYVIQVEATPTPEADDPADDYEMVDQNKTDHAPYSSVIFFVH
jgi:hypothetical protein